MTTDGVCVGSRLDWLPIVKPMPQHAEGQTIQDAVSLRLRWITVVPRFDFSLPTLPNSSAPITGIFTEKCYKLLLLSPPAPTPSISSTAYLPFSPLNVSMA
jgi:hypothetical protein